jgi:hypothetical protein
LPKRNEVGPVRKGTNLTTKEVVLGVDTVLLPPLSFPQHKLLELDSNYQAMVANKTRPHTGLKEDDKSRIEIRKLTTMPQVSKGG